jgi:hypothetical protein
MGPRISRPRKRRALSADELALVEKTLHPLLETLTDRKLVALRKLLRARRDRAQKIAARQRRELRGKSRPKGARASADDTGTWGKRDLLSAAVQRLDTEVQRREKKYARHALIESAMRALKLRQTRDAKAARPSSGRTPGTGMLAKTSSRSRTPRNRAKAGAISQHTKNMQAKRDSK